MSSGVAEPSARHRRAGPARRRDRRSVSRTRRVRAYSRAELDISDFDAVMARVRADRPDVIINCAAYNNVDRAEDEPDKALNVNAFAVRVLARAAAEDWGDARALQHRFRVRRPRRPSVRRRGSRRIRKACTRSRNCSENGLRWRRRARSCCASRACSAARTPRARSIASRRPLRKAARRRCFAIESCRRVTSWTSPRRRRALLERGEPGLYHCVGTGHANWYEVGLEIARVMGKERDARLQPVSVADVSLRAPRPQFAALANDKLSRVVPVPTWQDALRRYLA